jgi:hypothetical protein
LIGGGFSSEKGTTPESGGESSDTAGKAFDNASQWFDTH